MTRTSVYYGEVVHIGGTALRLHSFLELFDENIIVKIYGEEGILTETCIGDVPQRVLNCFGNNRSQAQKNSGYHYLRACRPIFAY